MSSVLKLLKYWWKKKIFGGNDRINHDFDENGDPDLYFPLTKTYRSLFYGNIYN